MSDIQYGADKKRIVFYDTDERHAQLKIRLKYDSLKQTEFFQVLISAYLDHDERICQIVDEHKERKKAKGKGRGANAESKKLREKARDVQSKFSLENEEVESIFDILEKEHPEL
jgi:hypothetical protein